MYLNDKHSIKLSVQFSAFHLLTAYTGELQVGRCEAMHFPAQNQQKNVSSRPN